MTPEDRKPVKWRWIILEAAAWLLVPLTILLVYLLKPTTLEKDCHLNGLDNCQLIQINLTCHPTRTTDYDTRYWTTETRSQFLTPEDASYALIMDLVREQTFRPSPTLIERRHKKAEEDTALSWSIELTFYDSMETSATENDWEHRLTHISLSRHCAEHNCVYYSHWDLPPESYSGASNTLYAPLHTILETVAAEKGGWLNSEE